MRRYSQNQPFLQPRLDETLFSLANGYLGVRASASEVAHARDDHGSYVNGFYDRIPMQHAEMAVGFPTEIDKLVRIIDTQTILIYLDGELVVPSSDNVSDYQQELLMDEGIVIRSFHYHHRGKTALIRFERMASLWEPCLFVYRLDVTYDGQITVDSLVEAEVYNHVDLSDPRVGSHAERLLLTDELTSKSGVIHYRGHTATTQATLHAAISHRSSEAVDTIIQGERSTSTIKAQGSLSLEKWLHVTDSYHYENPEEALKNCLDKTERLSYDTLKQLQNGEIQAFWVNSAIELFSQADMQPVVAYLQYQLFQNAPRSFSGNIAAKGLSGEGYEGHYFWDSEIFLLPVLEWLTPELAKPLLRYRYQILNRARERAKIMGHYKGACYPWRTISGIECSGYYPAGSAQYHLNGDVAHAIMQHFLIHDDLELLSEIGAEILFETARLWLEIGHYDQGGFHIFNVTGPDEYTAVVNDNYYTNLMAKQNLLNALFVYEELKARDPEGLERLKQSIGLQEEELEQFRQAGEQMVLPYDEELGIHAQDDSFLRKPIWDMSTHGDLRPLLLNVHPLTIYRHQVLKQADTVLAYTMVESDEEVMRRSFYYYEQLTTHDSSLSRCSYGIMASRLGDLSKAFAYFRETLFLDMHDTQGNTKDGLHMANVAGALLSVLTGFAGLRVHGHRLSLRPKCPDELDGYAFPFHYRGRKLKLTYQDGYRLELLAGEPLELEIDGEMYYLQDVLEGGRR